MAELRLTPAALGDLEDIWIYTERQWGAAQAERYVDTPNVSHGGYPWPSPACDHLQA